VHAQKHHRGAHRPPYLNAVKPTDQPRPGPQPGPEQKPGSTPRKASPAQEGRLAKLATFTTDLRMVSLNLLLLIGVCLAAAMLWKLIFARETLIENIYVPEAFAKIGYSSETFQSFVAGHLIALEARAADVIPASAKEEIKLDSDMPDFSVPGTSISAKTIHLGQRHRHPGPLRFASGPGGARRSVPFCHARRLDHRSGPKSLQSRRGCVEETQPLYLRLV
jgi:hypothetical protein